jgi:hypothetical protein
MGFLVNKITGNGTAQVAVTNDATLEAVVNSLVAYNTTAGALDFSVLIDDSVVFTESVDANGTFRIPDKINLGANGVLKVNANTGVDVTVSYLQQAIDVAGALSTAQLAAQSASDDADRAEAALGTTASPSITGIIKEQVSVSTLTLGATSSVQTYTATGNFTIVDDLASGESVVFYLTNAGFVPTYPTITWVVVQSLHLVLLIDYSLRKIGTTLVWFHTAYNV